MDWRYNTIWFDQIDRKKIFHRNYKDEPSVKYYNFTEAEYAMLFYYKYSDLSYDIIQKSDNLLYLEVNYSRLINLNGINKFINLKSFDSDLN